MAEHLFNLLCRLVSNQLSADEVPPSFWPQIVELALEQSLGPYLAWRLTEAGIRAIPDADCQRLINASRQTALADIVLEQAQQEMTSALREAAIPALWLKGIALAQTVYPQPGLRPMGDLDVLVPYELRDRALGVAQSLGYTFYTGGSGHSSGDALTLRLSHHYHLKRSAGHSVLLEIHFRLLSQNDEVLPLAQLEWFWGNRQIVRTENGFEFETLSPEAHLLYLCAHAMLQHGEENVPLVSFLDLHQLVTQMSVNWNVVIDRAVELGWTVAVVSALRRTGEYFSTPIPYWVLSQLFWRKPAGESAFQTTRLRGSGNRWERVRRKMKSLSTQDQFQYALRILFPAPSYMRARYEVKSGRPIFLYYPYRWFDQGCDVLWSLWKRFARR